jgi:hypothetical protein
MAGNALSRLLNGLRREPHDYRASLQTFPDLNVDAVAREMTLARQGAEHGRKEEPESERAGLDSTETSIVERVEAAKSSAYATLLDQKNLYEERLASLDFESRFADIRQAAPEAISELRASAALGRDELNRIRRDLAFKEKERDGFRARHRLTRAARISSGGSKTLKIGVLMVFVLIELFINGSFLAKGNEAGLFGGIIEALAFAALNVVFSFALAFFGIRLINRRGFFSRLVGLIALVALVAFAVGLNLVLAHYREVSAEIVEQAGQQALQRVLTHPLALTDLKSWLLFGIGLAFACFAMIDALLFDDPYPGYAGVEKRLNEAHDRYTAAKRDQIADLDEIRRQTGEGLEEANRDLSIRRNEYDAILENRARVYTLFAAHQDQLERAANTLLSIYRDANRQARSTPAPKRFANPVRIERIKEPLPDTGVGRADLRQAIADAQKLLADQVREVNAEFETLVERYQQIDDLVAE